MDDFVLTCKDFMNALKGRNVLKNTLFLEVTTVILKSGNLGRLGEDQGIFSLL